jgi:sterol-4alpha-carboxylate 3-dehydrogenase (decarboxylating)
LRTTGVYGPGDPHRFPQVLKAARKEQWIHIGDGSARFGHVYVANVVEAHRLAAEALTSAAPPAGHCYFIGDQVPSNFYTFFEPFLKALGYPPTHKRMPYRLAYLLAVVSERLSKWGLGSAQPKLTRYVVASTCVDFFFSYAKAQKDFGYHPIVSEEQAFAETCQWLSEAGYGCG